MLSGELSGEYGVKLDDMGRVGLPRQLRDIVEKSEMVLLRGEQPCLWLYTKEQWKTQKEKALRKTPSIHVRRRWNAQQSVEIDKQGRILIPATLRKYAQLFKDCIVVGQDYYIEVWASDRYDEYIQATSEGFMAACEGLELEEGDFGDGGDSAHSGAAGADLGVPSPEGGG